MCVFFTFFTAVLHPIFCHHIPFFATMKSESAVILFIKRGSTSRQHSHISIPEQLESIVEVFLSFFIVTASFLSPRHGAVETGWCLLAGTTYSHDNLSRFQSALEQLHCRPQPCCGLIIYKINNEHQAPTPPPHDRRTCECE